MALTSWDVFSKLRQGKQVINHLWVAKDTASNDLYVLEVDAASGGFPITFAADKNWGVVGANTLRTAAIVGNELGLADFGSGLTTAQTLRVALTSDTPIALGYDENWGVVGTTTLRTAAQIGNATGAADFNLGASSAQTLRTAANLALAGTAIPAGFGTITTGMRVASQIGNATGAADFAAGNASAQTLRTVIATDQAAIPVTLADPLDFGVTTSALRTASVVGNATGAALFGAGGTTAQVLRVVLPTDQTAIPVTVTNVPSTVPVDFGVTTIAERVAAVLGNITGAALFGAGSTTAQVLRVVLPTDQTVIPVNIQYAGTPAPLDFGVSTSALRVAALLGNATGLVTYGTGADSTQTLRTTLSTRAETAGTPLATRAGNGTSFADFGAGTTGTTTPRVTANITRNGTELSYDAGASDANTQRVVLADGANSKYGLAKVGQSYNDYTSTAVTTSAYVQLVASTAAAVNLIEIFDSSGQALILAVGGAGSEVDQLYIFPGGNGQIPLRIAASSRVSIKAKTATANVGYNAINFYG